jgi:hypothetical protein
MNVQAYTEAMERRLQLRRDLRERLQQIHETAAALAASAGMAAPGTPKAAEEQLPAAHREPLTKIEPQCARAAVLTEALRRNQSETAAVEQALRTEQWQGRVAIVRAVALSAGVVAGVGAFLLR